VRQELSDSDIERQLRRRATGKWRPERVLAAVRRAAPGVQQSGRIPRWAALVGAAAVVALLAVLAVALPALAPGPAASPGPPEQLEVLSTGQFAASLARGELDGRTVLVEGQIGPIVDDVPKGRPPCGPRDPNQGDGECLDALGSLVGADGLVISKRWVAVPEQQATLHGGPRDGWQWWDSPTAPVEGGVVLSVGRFGSVEFLGTVGYATEEDVSWEVGEVSRLEPQAISIDEVLVVDGWLTQVSFHPRCRTPAADEAGLPTLGCGRNAWIADRPVSLSMDGRITEPEVGVRVQNEAMYLLRGDREATEPVPGQFVVARRLFDGCADGSPPCWGWQVLTALWYQDPTTEQSPPDIATPELPSPMPSATPDASLAAEPTTSPRSEPSPARRIECVEIVRGRASPSDRPPLLDVFITDHSGVLQEFCQGLGAASGDSDGGVRVINPEGLQSVLEVWWTVPEACDYMPAELEVWRTATGLLVHIDRRAVVDQPQSCRTGFGRQGVALNLREPIWASSVETVLTTDGAAMSVVDMPAAGMSWTLSLVPGKTEYAVGEPIDIAAILAYDGDMRTRALVGSGSGLVVFSIGQLDGDLSMGGLMTSDCRPYEITSGEPLTLPYIKGGGWSADDPNAGFYREWVEDPVFTLPAGAWRVWASADFALGECGGRQVRLDASIVVTVR
jgi:hypothetical protein